MKKSTLTVFYQGEGIRDVQCVDVESETTFATLRVLLVEKHDLVADVLGFLEDGDEPLAADDVLKRHSTPRGLKLHLHQRRRVGVQVTFNGRTVKHRFPPSATVGRVRRWAAETEFGMSREEAGEHVLQIVGTHDRPSMGAHVGALTDPGSLIVAFDLVPNERINGAVRRRR